MLVSLTEPESRFLANLLLSQDATLPQYDFSTCAAIVPKVVEASVTPTEFASQDIGFLQSIMQDQSEIWGRQSSTANEKQPVMLGAFVPQGTRQLIKSISDKLGAKLLIDTATYSFPVSPRAEGSPSIMTDPTLNK
jgi:hypothetical protein